MGRHRRPLYVPFDLPVFITPIVFPEGVTSHLPFTVSQGMPTNAPKFFG